MPLTDPIIGIRGPTGAGKGITTTYYALKLHLYAEVYNLDWKIWSNMPFQGPLEKRYIPIKPADILNIEGDGLVVWDEVATDADSRMSISEKNRLLTQAAKTLRKRGNLKMIFQEQMVSAVDKRLHFNASYMLEPKILDRVPLPEPFDLPIRMTISIQDKFLRELNRITLGSNIMAGDFEDSQWYKSYRFFKYLLSLFNTEYIVKESKKGIVEEEEIVSPEGTTLKTRKGIELYNELKNKYQVRFERDKKRAKDIGKNLPDTCELCNVDQGYLLIGKHILCFECEKYRHSNKLSINDLFDDVEDNSISRDSPDNDKILESIIRESTTFGE